MFNVCSTSQNGSANEPRHDTFQFCQISKLLCNILISMELGVRPFLPDETQTTIEIEHITRRDKRLFL